MPRDSRDRGSSKRDDSRDKGRGGDRGRDDRGRNDSRGRGDRGRGSDRGRDYDRRDRSRDRGGRDRYDDRDRRDRYDRDRSPPRSVGPGGRQSGNWGGDWVCDKCETNNFARRTECFKCGAPKKLRSRSRSR
eukprot:TRINITY_DN1245_c0_g1_i1.p1 TRINITY_DN1245_c0_g1~~TRINITY_DN1245_c0_g1_i1.p1  ORF type:complete len:132 (+),score=8.03 TRINITY_DN1245_c0_g1_i1:109-504(+)